MDNNTDGQLYMSFLKTNDEEIFRVIYEKYRDGLFLFIYGIVQNSEDAEELMMDTFAILSSGTARYKQKDNAGFKTWLYAIARNRARMHLRKLRPIQVSLEDDMLYENEDGALLPEQELLSDERNVQLYRALETLKADYRQVLYLMYFEELKPEQIARIMKKSVKQIYNLTTRGKAAFKEALERMGYSRDMQ